MVTDDFGTNKIYVGKFNVKTKFDVSPAEIMNFKEYEWTNAFV
jgi:hypothetical protein